MRRVVAAFVASFAIVVAGSSARADDDALGVQHTEAPPPSPLPVDGRATPPPASTPDAQRAFGTGTAARALTPTPTLRVDVANVGPAHVAALGKFVLNAPEGPTFETGVRTELKSGPAIASVDAFVGKPLVAGRGDVDGEASAFAGVGDDTVRVGVMATARGELVDDVKTEDDFGRAVETFVGPAASLRDGPAELTVEVGYETPRGLAQPGPAGFFVFHLDF